MKSDELYRLNTPFFRPRSVSVSGSVDVDADPMLPPQPSRGPQARGRTPRCKGGQGHSMRAINSNFSQVSKTTHYIIDSI